MNKKRTAAAIRTPGPTNNVIVWVDNIERTLSELRSGRRRDVRANAAAYKAELQALDKWICEEVATIPEANRKLVTDRGVWLLRQPLRLSADRRRDPGYSTLSEPSAREIAGLEDTLRSLAVNAILSATRSTTHCRSVSPMTPASGSCRSIPAH